MKKAICALAILILACSAVLGAGEGQDWSMNATILEACSCTMFCPCYFGGKPTGHDEHGRYCKFNMAIHVNSGHYGETSLDGAEFWLAGNLSAAQAVLTFDEAVAAEQRAGIKAALGKLFSPITWKSFTIGEDGDVEWRASTEKAVATLDGGKRAEMVLIGAKGMGGKPVVLENIVYWAADDNDGMVMMPNEVEAWRDGDDAFEFRGTNGFMITVSVASKAEPATATATGASP